jgi:hypothetical protein
VSPALDTNPWLRPRQQPRTPPRRHRGSVRHAARREPHLGPAPARPARRWNRRARPRRRPPPSRRAARRAAAPHRHGPSTSRPWRLPVTLLASTTTGGSGIVFSDPPAAQTAKPGVRTRRARRPPPPRPAGRRGQHERAATPQAARAGSRRSIATASLTALRATAGRVSRCFAGDSSASAMERIPSAIGAPRVRRP